MSAAMTALDAPSPRAGATRRRRVLVIVRDYPPANTPAALRALGFTRYLPEFGWDTSVMAVRSPARDGGAPARSRQAADPDRVYRAFGFDSKQVFSVGGRYPHLLAMPDRNVSWLPGGVIQALRAVRRDRVDVLLSTGPPLTAHCIAHVVQRIGGLPWVADVRDLWDGPPPQARLAHAVEHRLARRLLRACDRVTAVTDAIAAGLPRTYGVELAHKMHVLPNGFDEQEFAALDASVARAERFTIAHVGHTAGNYRRPGVYLAALRDSLDRGDLPSDTVMLFVGGDAASVRAQTNAVGLQDVVSFLERVPHVEALREMCSASALLLLQGDEFRHAVPSKAYEYLRSGRPIAALVTPDGESARLLRQFPGVFLASPERPDEIAAALRAAYHAWRNATVIERPPPQLAGLTRRATAAALAPILDQLCLVDGRAARGRR
jgi:glycosyltransferase involved in cell wall biosynthesis